MTATIKTTDSNMFEIGTKAKIRFPSSRGPTSLTIEDLWDLPLESKDDFNLDAVAKAVNKQLQAASEESFVRTTKSTAQGRLELALDILKYIIQSKQDDDAAAKKRAEKKKEKEQLLGILAEKQAGKLSDLSEAELKKRIAALDD